MYIFGFELRSELIKVENLVVILVYFVNLFVIVNVVL